MSVIKVTFTEVEEFISELGKDVGKIERGLVRRTKIFTPSTISPIICDVSVFSAYTVEGQVVTFEHHCGPIWGINKEKDDGVISKANQYLNTIEEECKRLGIECRAGKLEG